MWYNIFVFNYNNNYFMQELNNIFKSSYSIVNSEAADSYGKLISGPLETGAGKKTTRLDLLGQNHLSGPASTAGYVYVETIEKGCWAPIKEWILSKMDRRFVRATLNKGAENQAIFINVNSLSKRFGITKDEIYRSAKEGNLEELIQEAQKQYAQREQQIDDLYQNTLKNYLVSMKTDQLYTSDTKSMTGMTPQTLHKLIGLSLTLLKTASSSFIELEGQRFLFQKNRDGIEFFLFSQSTIGEGCFGQVKEVTRLWTGTTHIAKLAANPSVGEELKNEFFILNWLHSKGRVRGVQKAPYRVFDLKNGNAHKIGYIAPRYDYDLEVWTFSKMPLQYQLECAHQLLDGLQACASRNVRLGDIKPSNCLIKVTKTENGKIHECVLSDFGGAKQLTDKEVIEWGIGAPDYICHQDYQEFKRLKEKLNKAAQKGNKQEKILEKMRQIQKARDVYALGLTFQEIFEIDLLPKQLGEKLELLIDQMTCSDYKKRPAAKDAFQKLNDMTPIIQRKIRTSRKYRKK